MISRAQLASRSQWEKGDSQEAPIHSFAGTLAIKQSSL